MHSVVRTVAVFFGVCAVAVCSQVGWADFEIAYTTGLEKRPAVAYNPQTDESLVVYLAPYGGHYELRARRIDADGNPVGGELAPFGIGTHEAVGRPDVAYSPNSNIYYVAVAERLSTNDRVLARPLDAAGNALPIPETLFDQSGYRLYEEHGAGHSTLRVTHNSVLDQFLVTFQRTFYTPEGDLQTLVGQRISGGFREGAQVVLFDYGVNGFGSHGVAHAPVTTSPAGGLYFIGIDAGNLEAFTATLGPAPIGHGGTNLIPIHTGFETGQAGQADIAYGRVEGKDRLLVVWSDGNNCRPTVESCPGTGPLVDQWTGVWGTYIDPARAEFGPGSDNTPFPISKIFNHVGGRRIYKPRVAYVSDAKSFFVTWFEYPFDDSENDESRTHIRANWVDYFVDDNLLGTTLPTPHDNAVVSNISGTCPPATTPPIPGTCPSLEEPDFPDIAAVKGQSAIVVWEQRYPPAPNPDLDHDIMGDFLKLVAPANDSKGSAPELTGYSLNLEGSLLGATNDGSADCGDSAASADTWYEYLAPAAGTLVVSTCGTNDLFGTDTGMDTVLSLHDPVSGAQLSGACNDDFDPASPQACGESDLGFGRDSLIEWPVEAGQRVLIRVSSFGGVPGLRFLLHLELSASGGAGRVPDGTDGEPLMIGKGAGGMLTLSWGPSCLVSDTDYEVYEGALGTFQSHEPRTCSTGGANSWTLSSGGGSSYFLVVPTNGSNEGSHGSATGMPERPPGPVLCRTQQVTACE